MSISSLRLVGAPGFTPRTAGRPLCVAYKLSVAKMD